MSRPQPRKRKPARSFAGSHQRSWLWGRHAVAETLIAGRWPIYDLIVHEDDGCLVAREILPLADRRGLVCHRADDARMTQLTGSTEHQGVAARMGEFPLGDLPALVSAAGEPSPAATANGVRAETWPPVFVVCDRIQDAHNFGAILRCCDAASTRGIIIGDWQQSAVTPHVARSSAGAVNHLDMFQVSSLVQAVTELRSLGYTILGASEKASVSLWQAAVGQRQVLIVGSEATGISSELLALCDQLLGIPMLGHVGSLNVAVATGILLTEIRRRQHEHHGGA